MTDRARRAVLRVRGLTRRFGGVVAVRDVDLDIAPGERRAVLGPNGAGKSTLFNLIAGADTPTSGSIELFGADVTRARRPAAHPAWGCRGRSRPRGCSPGLTVEDNLYLAADRRGRRAASGCCAPAATPAARERARRTAESVGMTDRLDTLAGDLSHGEQRQLEIGLALVAEPRMLLLDEPAAGLSRAERQLLTALLLSLDRDVTLLLIEHDMDVALTVAERVTMMHDGVVIVEGTPAEIRADQRVHDLYLGKAHV